MPCDYDIETPEYLKFGIMVFQAYLLSDSEDNHIDLCANISGYRRGDIVCDMGCGPGYVAHKMSLMGINVSGVTNSRFQYQYATLNYPNVRFLLEDMTRTSFDEGTFDAVQWMESIGYANHDDAFSEAFRITNEKGRVIVKDFSAIGDASDIFKHWSYKIIPSSEMINSAERAGFKLSKAFILNADDSRFKKFCFESDLMKKLHPPEEDKSCVPFWYEFAKKGCFAGRCSNG